MNQKQRLERNLVFDSPQKGPAIVNEYLTMDNQAIQRGSVYGQCLLCGQDVLFSVYHANLREALVCPICKSYNRQRQLIAAISLELFNEIITLEAIMKRLKKGYRILLLESVTNLAEAMKYYAHDKVEIVDTEYIDPALASGEVGNTGVMHLDIEQTHFEDDYFDLIVHADVFEHVADAPAAEAEQIRILKKGGKAIYTAPFDTESDADEVYAEMRGGDIKYHRDPVYHGDPSPREDTDNTDGCLVFRVFSYRGMHERYRDFGATFSCRYLYGRRYGMLGNNGYVFVATKSAERRTKTKASRK